MGLYKGIRIYSKLRGSGSATPLYVPRLAEPSWQDHINGRHNSAELKHFAKAPFPVECFFRQPADRERPGEGWKILINLINSIVPSTAHY